VTPFAPLDWGIRRVLEAEAKDVGRFLGTGAAVTVVNESAASA